MNRIGVSVKMHVRLCVTTCLTTRLCFLETNLTFALLAVARERELKLERVEENLKNRITQCSYWQWRPSFERCHLQNCLKNKFNDCKMPFCIHNNIISKTFLIINLLNQQVSVPHPLYFIGHQNYIRRNWTLFKQYLCSIHRIRSPFSQFLQKCERREWKFLTEKSISLRRRISEK